MSRDGLDVGPQMCGDDGVGRSGTEWGGGFALRPVWGGRDHWDSTVRQLSGIPQTRFNQKNAYITLVSD